MSELLWVAVPAGLVAGTDGAPPTLAAVRVLVVPRLTGVDIAEDQLRDWPARLTEEAGFRLWTATSAGVRVSGRRPILTSCPRSQVWQAFFGGAAGQVIPYQRVTPPAPDVTPSSREARTVAGSYRSVTRTAAVPAADVPAAIRTELGANWHQPEAPTPPEPTAPPQLRTDFHATVDRLRQHPAVLLDTGLVFEVHIAIADLLVGDPAAERLLSIRCDDPPSLQTLVVSPWTRYDVDVAPPDTGFWPAPNDTAAGGVRRGMLDLTGAGSVTSASAAADAPWAVACFDVDGAVGALRQTARDLRITDARRVGPAATPDGAQPVMPPLRSAGLTLLRPGREADLRRRRQRALDRRSPLLAEEVFGAEDLVLGYRLDVRRGAGSWRSVCRREVRYTVRDAVGSAEITIGGADDAYLAEEGHVAPLAATRDRDGALHADETVLRWQGWSLVLPRPDLSGVTDGPARRGDAELPYRFDWEYRVPPGALPALRFADRYRMRVRIADIAGGGLGLAEARGNQHATADVVYARHEPVGPPILGGVGPFGPGGALDRMVLRGDNDATPLRRHADDADGPLVERRTLAPPTTSLLLAEAHGAFDALTDDQSWPLARAAMSADGGGLRDPAAGGVNALVRRGDGSPAELSDDDPWPRWPTTDTKTIEARPNADATQPVALRWVDRVLHVAVARGHQVTLELSSTVPGGMRDHLAADEFLRGGAGAQPVDPAATLAGRNPLVTPPRSVLVVHAVRRPLADPTWTLRTVTRGAGDTAVTVEAVFADAAEGGAGLHTASTGRLDVAAQWREYADTADTAGDLITRRSVHAQAVDPAGPDPTPLRMLHDFGDTKRRTVTYVVDATSRYRDYFAADEPDTAFRTSRPQPAILLRSTARPVPPVVLGVVPSLRWERTRPAADRIEVVRRGRRLRVELARPWFVTGEQEQLAVVLAPDATGAAAGSDLVSRAGRDPLFAGAPVTGTPAADWFAAALPGDRLRAIDVAAEVVAVPFPVTAAGDGWYADIELRAAVAGRWYQPLITLALARYQRETVADPSGGNALRLSRIVVADPVPLLPDRLLTVTRNGRRLTVTVTGPGPVPANQLEVVVETCEPGSPAETLDLVVGGDDDAPVAGWRPVSRVTRTAAGDIPAVAVPDVAGPLRLRVREWENHLNTDTSPQGVLMSRNVFVDTVVLPDQWRA